MVNSALPITAGSTLWVDVGQAGPPAPGGDCSTPPLAGGLFDGGAGNACSGGGGGSSALLTAPRASAQLTGNGATDARLLVAGGGGGGGAGAAANGGSAGDAAVTGAGSAVCSDPGVGAPGGIGPTDGTAGGGAGCGEGANGSASSGGAGFEGGGGGGGGWFGGGGGPVQVQGGGGGSSYGGEGPSAGISIATASSSDAPEVVISWTVFAPTASITAPANGATYAQGQVVNSSFSCIEGAGGPGLASCLDQNGHPSGTAIDTSTPGQYTFTVTATSNDGLARRSSVTYVVSKPPAAKAPTAATVAATNISHAAATLHGRVNPNGSATSYFFQYGTSSAYGKRTTSRAAGAGTITHARSATIVRLTPGRTYHFRIVARNRVGTRYGAGKTFTTPPRPLKLSVSPRRTQTGVRACFAFRATFTGHPVAGAIIRFAHRTARTSHARKATICLRLGRGSFHAIATKTGFRSARATVTATAPTPAPRFTG